MNILGIGSLIADLFGGVRDIIDSTYTSEEEKDEALQQLRALQSETLDRTLQYQEKIVQAQKEVLVAELKGDSWMQRNWRPLLMMVFVAILANNFLVSPLLTSFGVQATMLNFPAPFWGLLTLSISGYIGARTFEKYKGLTTDYPMASPPQIGQNISAHLLSRKPVTGFRDESQRVSWTPSEHKTRAIGSSPEATPKFGPLSDTKRIGW